jgi:hypothetical protein
VGQPWKIILLMFLCSYLLFGFAGAAYAEKTGGDSPNMPSGITSGVSTVKIEDATSGLWTFITSFMKMVTAFCGIAIVVIGGKIAANATNPQKRSENIAGLIWAVGGAAVSSGAWLLVGVATGVW